MEHIAMKYKGLIKYTRRLDIVSAPYFHNEWKN